MIPTIETLSGRAALVTGGSRGIGRAICVALADAGVRVAVGYRQDEAAASEVVAVIVAAGGTAVACKADVSDPGEAAGLVRRPPHELTRPRQLGASGRWRSISRSRARNAVARAGACLRAGDIR